MRSMRRGAKALLALAAIVPALAVSVGVRPASAVDVGIGEFSIEGKGAFATGLSNLTITQPINAKNEGATRTDLHWVLVPFTINDGRANPNSNVEVAAPEGTTLNVGTWYENAVGLRPGSPGIRFDGCETETGRFIVDEFVQSPTAPFTITKLVIRFEHHCNGTVIGSISWNGTAGKYAAHRTGGQVTGGIVDFGTVTSGAPQARTVTVTNTGDKTLNIASVAKSGFGADDFTIGAGCNGQSLTIGSSCNISVTANPQIDGPSDAILRIFDQFTGADPSSPLGGGEAIELRVNGQGSGNGRLDLDGEVGNPVADGARVVKTGVFSASGNTVSMTGASLSFTISTTTAMVTGGVYTIGSDASLALTAGGLSCAAPAGRLSIVERNGNANFVARFRITCAGGDRVVVGQAVYAPTTPIVSRLVTPPSALVFGTAVTVGQASAPQSIAVTNQGRADTTVSARLTGDAGSLAQFSLILNTCDNVVLAPGKSCNILVVFAPVTPNGALASVSIRDTFSDQQDRRVFVQGVSAIAAPGYIWQVDGEFVPVPPSRILDTRLDASVNNGTVEPVRAGAPRLVDVTGKGGVPAGGVSAAVLNVTVDNPSAPAYLTVYPTTASNTPPTASNLNFVRGQTVPNLVVAPIGDGGRVSLYTNSGEVNVIIDVVGWITSDSSETRGSRLAPLAPTRILDTRTGTGAPAAPLGGGAAMTLQVAPPGDGYTAAVINLTGVEPTASTYVTAYPSNVARPLASNLNLVAGQVRPNLVMVQLSPTGTVDLYNFAGNVNLVADLVGLFKAGGVRETQTGRIKPINPTRVIYTPNDGPGGRLDGGTVDTWDMGVQSAAAGLANFGAGANKGFIANFTATEGTSNTYMTAYPSDQARPTASNLNVLPNENVPNLSVVSLSASNTFDVFNNTGQIHYIFDVVARIAA